MTMKFSLFKQTGSRMRLVNTPTTEKGFDQKRDAQRPLADVLITSVSVCRPQDTGQTRSWRATFWPRHRVMFPAETLEMRMYFILLQ